MRPLRGSRPIATSSPIVPRLIRAPVPLGITTLTSHRFQTCHARKVRILSSYCNRRSTQTMSFVRDMHTYVSLSRSAVTRRASAFRVPTVSPSRSNAASQHRNEKRPRAPRGKPETQTGTARRPKRPLCHGFGSLGLEAARRDCIEFDADMNGRQRARRRRSIAAPAWHPDVSERDTTPGRLPHARGHAVDAPDR